MSEAEMLASSGAGGGGGGGVVGSAQTDVTNPYEAVPCGCVYCFVCLAQKIEAEEGEGWTCLRCGEVVKECRPWSGDVVVEEASSRPGTGKSVGFAEGTGRGLDGTSEDKGAVREVEPRPMQDEAEAEVEEEIERDAGSPGARILDESGEWARASAVLDEPPDEETSDEDQQSEEYDEGENEDGDADDLEAE